jgi:hypothetical protein
MAANVIRDVLALVGLNNTGNINARQTTHFMELPIVSMM